MSALPVTLGDQTFRSLDDLVAHITARARAGPEHPGQSHPAEWYTSRLQPGAPVGNDVEQALWEASERIVRDSDDPMVLSMAPELCGRCQRPTLFGAVLDRLDGSARPFPSTPADALRERFVDMGRQYFAVTTVGIRSRFRGVYESEGRHEAVVSILLAHDPDDALVSTVERYAAGNASVHVMASLGNVVSRNRPDDLVNVATAIAGLSTEHRETFRREVQRWNDGWYGQHESDLRLALKLPA